MKLTYIKLFADSNHPCAMADPTNPWLPKITRISFNNFDRYLDVKKLIETGHDVNYKDDEQLSPLAYAAIRNESDIAQLLLRNGADINSEDKNGWTPLSLAAFQNSSKVIPALITHNADINHRDPEGRTPLLLAAQHGCDEAVRILLDNDADRNIRDIENRSPFDHACLKAKEEESEMPKNRYIKIQKLLHPTPPHPQDSSSPGYFAPPKGAKSRGKRLRSLIDRWFCKGIKTPSEEFEEMKELLQGTHVDFHDEYDRGGSEKSPLMFAAQWDRGDVIKLLLGWGADVNFQTDMGQTPLHMAAENDSVYAMALLIQAGADINSQGRDEVTPLLAAARLGQLKSVQFLLAKGADPTITDHNERSAYNYACRAAARDANSKSADQSNMIRDLLDPSKQGALEA